MTIIKVADLIPEMVDECVDLNLADGDTRIIERTTDEGQTMKIACVAGTQEILRSDKTLDFIKANTSLSDEEKAKFKEGSGEGKRTFIMTNGTKIKDKFTVDGTVAAPAPPAAPEAPAELKGSE